MCMCVRACMIVRVRATVCVGVCVCRCDLDRSKMTSCCRRFTSTVSIYPHTVFHRQLIFVRVDDGMKSIRGNFKTLIIPIKVYDGTAFQTHLLWWYVSKTWCPRLSWCINTLLWGEHSAMLHMAVEWVKQETVIAFLSNVWKHFPEIFWIQIPW